LIRIHSYINSKLHTQDKHIQITLLTSNDELPRDRCVRVRLSNRNHELPIYKGVKYSIPIVLPSLKRHEDGEVGRGSRHEKSCHFALTIVINIKTRIFDQFVPLQKSLRSTTRYSRLSFQCCLCSSIIRRAMNLLPLHVEFSSCFVMLSRSVSVKE
jgi:hypothetical protein